MTEDMEKTAIGTFNNQDVTRITDVETSERTRLSANIECPVCRTLNPPSDTFCMDCGFRLDSTPCAMDVHNESGISARLIMADGSREFTLNPGENSVGRENSDILLVNNTVSRRHSVITVGDTRVFVVDIGSTNGTSVNGVKSAQGEETDLVDGCEVVFGSVALKFVAAETVDDTQTQGDDAAIEEDITQEETKHSVVVDQDLEDDKYEDQYIEQSVAAAAKLIPEDGSAPINLFTGTSSIGRRPENDITIPDPYCSGKHAEISVNAETIIITDNGSTNGTYVNGIRLEPNAPKTVIDGDVITFGKSAYRLEVPGDGA